MLQTQGRHVVRFSISGDAPEMCDQIAAVFPSLNCQTDVAGSIRIDSDEPVRVGPLVRLLEDHGAEVSEARKLQPSLEDVFVEITGIEARAMRQEKERSGKGSGR